MSIDSQAYRPSGEKTFDHLWVFAGGDFRVEDIGDDISQPGADGYVAVDYGVEHCLAAGVTPDLLVGDLDSVSASALADKRLLNVPRCVYPTAKDASDLELALRLLKDWRPLKISLLGVSGGRTDHMLFNWLLPLAQDWPFHLDLLDSTVHAFVVTPQRKLDISANPGQLLSLLPLTECTGVNLDGAEYSLVEASLRCGSTIGLSNQLTGDRFTLETRTGKLLAMLVR